MTDLDFFAQMAVDLHAEASTEHTVERVAAFACSALRCDDAGILLVHSRRKIETAAATSTPVGRAHDLQLEFDEGPCLDAIENPGVYLTEDVRADPTYRRWGPAVADLGYASVLSLPLQTHERRYGSLNFYAQNTAAFDERDVEVASIFTRHAAVAIAAAQNGESLQAAIDSRKLIGQAQGILMERFDLDADTAFDFLRRHSQQHNIKLREVAEQVVDHRRSWAPPRPADDVTA